MADAQCEGAVVMHFSEPFFDALVTCAEAFVDFAQDMTVGLSSVAITCNIVVDETLSIYIYENN